MADISKITLPSGTTYNIKDEVARDMASAGVSFTIATDAASTPAGVQWKQDGTVITGTLVAAQSTKGTFVLVPDNMIETPASNDIYGEYVTITNESGGTTTYSWEKIGTTSVDLSDLGALAYADRAEGTFTPAGSVALTGSVATVSPASSGTATYQPAGSVTLGNKTKVTVLTGTGAPTYTPAGSVSFSNYTQSVVSPAESGNSSYTPTGTVQVNATTGAGTSYTPSGTITVGTTSGTSYTPEGSISVNTSGSGTSYTPSGAIVVSDGSASSGTTYTPGGSIVVNSLGGAGTLYQPQGTISAPTINLSGGGATTTIKNPTKETVAKTVVAAAPGATAPSNAITYYSVANETLSLYQLGYTTGDSITTSDVTVKTGDATYAASQPEFTGTSVKLGFDGETKKFAFEGSERKLAFSGTEKKFGFSGTEKKLNFSGTPVRLLTSNTIPAAATFSGTGAHLETSQDVPTSASFTGTGVRLKVDTNVPTGATFTGTEGTVTVAPED